jgi:hypothetical protein
MRSALGEPHSANRSCHRPQGPFHDARILTDLHRCHKYSSTQLYGDLHRNFTPPKQKPTPEKPFLQEIRFQGILSKGHAYQFKATAVYADRPRTLS